jgi:hypothetical protein
MAPLGAGQLPVVVVAKFYPKDFSITDLRRLTYQLGNFIADMCGDERFSKVKACLTLICLQACKMSAIATACNCNASVLINYTNVLCSNTICFELMDI